ncbi:hypothetical protein GCM10020256_34110 [Streptomyces thermocoprophilus]
MGGVEGAGTAAADGVGPPPGIVVRAPRAGRPAPGTPLDAGANGAATTTVPPRRRPSTWPSSASLRYASVTTPRDSRSSAARTRVGGSLLPTATRPSAMARRSSPASQSALPSAGTSRTSS